MSSFLLLLLFSTGATADSFYRDPLLERLLMQSFSDVLRPLLATPPRFEPVSFFGQRADPLWLWPLRQHLREPGVFEAVFSACDVHMHNLRSVDVERINIWRRRTNSTEDDDGLFDIAAVGARFTFPLLWLSGYYKQVDIQHSHTLKDRVDFPTSSLLTE